MFGTPLGDASLRSSDRSRGRWRHIAGVLPLLLTALAVFVAVSTPSSEHDRVEAAAETADWFPLQGSWTLWCTMSNPSTFGNCAGYHGYFAMDIGVPGTGSLPIGTPVFAAGPGIVVELEGGCAPATANGCGGGAGNHVGIKHPDGRTSRYLHLATVAVGLNQAVARGQRIGGSGNSGSSSTAHLHYEERVGDWPSWTPVDVGPMKALVNGAVVQYPDYVGKTTFFGPSGVPYGTTIRNDGYQRKAAPGDFDGDNDADRATYDQATGVWRAVGSADTTFGGAGAIPVSGDYDGDGDVQAAVYRPASGLWSVAGEGDVSLGGPGRLPVPADYLGDGRTRRATFEPSTGVWSVEGQADVPFGGPGRIPVPGDYDGDGDADRATYDPANGAWAVQGLANVTLGGRGEMPVPADYDGDGRTDRATYSPSTGTWRVDGMASVVAGGFGQVPVPADFTGDGKADRATYHLATGLWRVPGQADVVAGGPNQIPVSSAGAATAWRLFAADARSSDTDGDGRSEPGVYRSGTGEFRVVDRTPVGFGAGGDVGFLADMDADGRSDRVVFRPSAGVFFVDLAGWLPLAPVAGVPGDVPLVAPLVGDGSDEVAVFRPSTGQWFVAGQTWAAVTAPQPGDLPVLPDIDLDGVTDRGVFRPATGEWFVEGQAPLVFGQLGDIPVVADLNLDERSDLAVFRPSTGQWLSSAPGFPTVAFGQAGDIPLAHDTVGLGAGVLAVYRPSIGMWLTRNGASYAVGQAGDVPLPRSAGSVPFPLASPTSAVAVAGSGSATVSFAPPPPSGGGPAVGYLVQASPGGASTIATAGVGSATGSATLNGLTGGVPYTFTVRTLNGGGYGPTSAPSASITPTAESLTGYHPLSPFRALDTRDGTGGLVGPFASGQTRSFDVVGIGGGSGVPNAGVAAVVLNVTATNATAGSHLTVFPAGQLQPTASNLNFVAGQTVPNLVVAKVGANGRVSIFNNAGTAHVIADVVGWFDTGAPATGSRFNPVAPYRTLDTRDGTGGLTGTFASGQTRSFTATGSGGVPTTGVTAVVLNVTVTAPTAASHLTVFPAGQPQAAASNLNFVAGQTVPNLVVATVGANGRVDIFNNAGTTHVIADVVGWFGATGSGFVGLTPSRVIDTRDGVGLVGPFSSSQTRSVDLDGRGGLPGSGAKAVVLNVTVTGATAASFLALFPGGQGNPGTSNVNFVAGQTVPNLVVVPVGPDGTVQFFNASGSVHVIADVVGWFG